MTFYELPKKEQKWEKLKEMATDHYENILAGELPTVDYTVPKNSDGTILTTFSKNKNPGGYSGGSGFENKNKNKSDKKCLNCKIPGHFARDCHKECKFFCNKGGHKSKDCPEKGGVMRKAGWDKPKNNKWNKGKKRDDKDDSESKDEDSEFDSMFTIAVGAVTVDQDYDHEFLNKVGKCRDDTRKDTGPKESLLLQKHVKDLFAKIDVTSRGREIISNDQ